MDERRRSILRTLGKGSVFLAFIVQIGAALRALVPNVLYEAPRRFKLRKPDDYPQGVTFDEARRLFVVHEENRLHVLSAVCTHLGCTVQWKQEKREFACPCHGSHFDAAGTVISGPAPSRLSCFGLAIAPDGSLVVDSVTEVAQDFRLIQPAKTA
jgi:cytochrome b6-f complex iron-sulfur subunit